MSDVEYSLRRQTEAARDLLATIRSEGAEDDADLVADAIEGETDLLEAIRDGLDEIDEAELLILGGKAKIKQIEDRVSSEERRVERVRAAIERAIVTSEMPTPIKLPTATISVSKRKPGVLIDDEAAIPARFFVQPPAPPPKVDKKSIGEALAANENVPGARLDNGSISLTVRRK
jgi:hypothetical protein